VRRMCVAVPGKVMEIKENMAKVDFNGNVIPVNISLVEVKVGDYCLVHAGYAVQVVDKEYGESQAQLFRDLEEAFHREFMINYNGR
jgi:hydrogenase expression/formation protein HypC